MSLDVTFHRLAELELCEAAQYYDAESPGLGATFIDEVEGAPRPSSSIPKWVRTSAVQYGAVSFTAFPMAFFTPTHLRTFGFLP